MITTFSVSLHFSSPMAKSARVYLFFPQRDQNLRPPSVTVSSHISGSNAVASQSLAISNVRVSLFTQKRFTLATSHPALSVQHPQGYRFDLLKNTSLLPVAPDNIKLSTNTTAKSTLSLHVRYCHLPSEKNLLPPGGGVVLIEACGTN